MTPHIRNLALPDLDALLSLYKHLHPHDDPLPSRETVDGIWDCIMADTRQIYLGSFVDDRLIAACNAAVILNLTRGARPYALIENVVTHPDFRRKGIGRELLGRLIDECRNRQCYKIMLMSNSNRNEAHAFYRSIGFDQEAKQAFVITGDRK